MVKIKDKSQLKKYSNQIETLNKEVEETLWRRNVELFFSFDIVNSSAYKTLNFTSWSEVIIKLFKRVQQMITETLPSAEMWRMLGDEIIFIAPIKEERNIFIYVDNIFEILNNIVNQLKKGSFFDNLSLNSKEKEIIKIQNVIALKGAAWIAIVGEHLKELEPYDNILERYKLQDGYGLFEFLGNDIDTGFRIKQMTHSKRLTISYESAYKLMENTDYLNNIHIITYKRLKGIWQNRLYPIIWYHNPKHVENIPFEDSFSYDEQENNELVNEYFKNRQKPLLKKYMYTNVYKALNKILIDQGLNEKLLKIQKVIEYSQHDVAHLLEPKFLLQLHCVAVCYDNENEKILIMKRSDNRTKLPSVWEFGCVKATLGKTLVEQITTEYKLDFDIKIQVDCDKDREDKQPTPLAIYEIENENGKDKGVITMAKIIGDYDINNFKKNSKHSELRWISENEIDNFSETTVTDFKHTLKLVFKKLKELKNNE